MMFLYIYIVFLFMMPAVLGVSLDQGPKAVGKAVGKTVYLPCKATGLDSSDYIHWYQIKDGEAPSRLLYISKEGSVTRDSNNPQTNDFTVDRKKLYDLKLSDTKKSHAAVYFCAYWERDSSGNWIKRFGTGTRLIVTGPGGDQTNPPVLSAYLPSVKSSDKQTMVCQASGMFPDLVKFTWKKKGNTGEWTDVSAGNVVEQRNETPNEKPNEKPNVVVTSMMIVDKNTAGENLYQCTVKHESGNEKTTSKILEKEKKVSTKEVIPKATCPPIPEKTLQRQISAASEQMPSLYLFVYAYGIMLMKNGVYFCAIFIFLLKRKFGKKE